MTIQYAQKQSILGSKNGLKLTKIVHIAQISTDRIRILLEERMDFGLINYLGGTPIIVTTRKIQNRTHKKKRINKKWAKRYGFTISETLKNGETYMMDGKLYMNQHTYTQLKTSIEFENLLKR